MTFYVFWSSGTGTSRIADSSSCCSSFQRDFCMGADTHRTILCSEQIWLSSREQRPVYPIWFRIEVGRKLWTLTGVKNYISTYDSKPNGEVEATEILAWKTRKQSGTQNEQLWEEQETPLAILPLRLEPIQLCWTVADLFWRWLNRTGLTELEFQVRNEARQGLKIVQQRGVKLSQFWYHYGPSFLGPSAPLLESGYTFTTYLNDLRQVSKRWRRWIELEYGPICRSYLNYWVYASLKNLTRPSYTPRWLNSM